MDQTEPLPQNLSGYHAVVTGAASGLGRAIAMSLARAGADLTIHTRSNQAGLDEVRSEITAGGRRCGAVLADIGLPADRCKLLEFATSAAPVDVWVNNAGADVLTGSWADRSFDEKLQRLWQVDVVGAINLSRSIGQAMRQSPPTEYGRRCIINIGWDQAAHGMAGDSGEMFAATKGAIMAFTKSLAASLAPHVRVNCLAPGWIRTKWGERADDYWDRRARAESLMQRWGDPADVAAVAAFVASPAASFITGQVIDINGGFRHSTS